LKLCSHVSSIRYSLSFECILRRYCEAIVTLAMALLISSYPDEASIRPRTEQAVVVAGSVSL